MAECLSPRLEAVVYMRCSGRGQIGGDTWNRQENACAVWATSNTHQIVTFYREEGISGTVEDRPEFQRMVADLMQCDCRLILVESLDRLAREYRVQEQLIIYLASKGIDLVAVNTGENVTQALMGDPMRRAMVQVQGIFAELDKNLTVAKLRKARQRKRDSGGRCEGRKAYGATEQERSVLALIRTLEAEQLTPAKIAEHLNNAGILSRSGGKWYAAVVARILAREKTSCDSLNCQKISLSM